MERLEKCLAGCHDPELAALLRVSGCAAFAAGKILRRLFGKPHTVTHKGAIDLVTEADLASEKKILEILRIEGPDIAILAEESQSLYDEKPTGPVWVIDPLDGTTNFAHNFPWFAVSIAYALGEKTQVGVIYSVMQDEFFCACRGSGAWLNGGKLAVSMSKSLERSLLGTGFPYTIKERAGEVIGTLANILPDVQGIRRAGAAAIDLAYVACGRLDGFWEVNLKPWDTAGGMLIIEEAGGKLSDFRGGKYDPYLPECVASNGKIHEALVERLGKTCSGPGTSSRGE